MSGATKETVPDEQWWYSQWAEFEDFVGIGRTRAWKLARNLRKNGESKFTVNRLLAANNLPHGALNSREATLQELKYDKRRKQ